MMDDGSAKCLLDVIKLVKIFTVTNIRFDVSVNQKAPKRKCSLVRYVINCIIVNLFFLYSDPTALQEFLRSNSQVCRNFS